MIPTSRAKKALGQHFLVDRGAVKRIVKAFDPRAGEPILEIGPGRGILTGPLIDAAGKIAAVEVDEGLAATLRTQHDPSRLVLFTHDVLRLDLPEVLRSLGALDGQRLAVVGNLPYNISKPVAQKLIRDRRHIDRAVLMFQREVATRLTADPGGRSYGPLSVLAKLTYHIERLFDLPPHAFVPRPRVVSSVTRWQRRNERALEDERERRLRAVLTACFARRRRTLRNNLRAALRDDRQVEHLLEAIETPGDLRAETLEPAVFLRMADQWNATLLL